MSTTISANDFLKYFEETPNIQGPTESIVIGQPPHPLQPRFLKIGATPESRIDGVVNTIFMAHTEIPIVAEAGNGILAFVPGRAHIEGIELEDALSSTDVQRYLARHASPLVVKRAVDDRETVNLNHFEPPEVGRQVILATTAAETSITFRDVAIVIDTGCANLPVYNPSLRTHELATVHVSRSQMDQRVGRAARVGSGTILACSKHLKAISFFVPAFRLSQLKKLSHFS